MRRILIGVGVAVVAAAAALPLLTSSAAASGGTSVTGVGVAPTTHAAGATDIEYAVSFNTASEIPSGGTVTLTAPSGATFDSDRNTYEVTIQSGTPTSAASVTVGPGGAADNVVDVGMPSAVAAGDMVTIDSYGDANPATSGNDNFSVATVSDTSPASVPFDVSPATSISDESVSASSNTTSEGAADAAWTVSFTTDQAVSDGNPDHVNDGAGYIQLTAPAGTVFGSARGDYAIGYKVGDQPSDLTPGGVLVGPGGDGDNVVDLWLPANIAADDIGSNAPVTVSAWGVTNPSTSSGSLSVSTSSDTGSPAGATSLSFDAPTQIPSLQVAVGASAAGATDVPWTYTFTTDQPISAGNDSTNNGVDGDGAGYLELTAPAGAGFNSNEGDYLVTYDVDGTPYTQTEPEVTVDPDDVGDDNVAEIQLGQNWAPMIPAGTAVTVVAYGTANPAAAAAASASASTSSDPASRSTSTPITAATAATAVTSTASSDAPSAAGVTDTLNLTTTDAVSAGNASFGDDGGGSITITAPAGTSLPAPSKSYKWVVSDAYKTVDLTNGVTITGGNVATIAVPFSLPAGDQVTVTIPDVTNAATDPDAPLSVVTSSDSVAATAATATAVTANAANASATVSWTAPSQSGITGYLVTPYTGGVAGQPDEISGSATSTTVGGLTNGTAYSFKVTALIGSAYGPESPASAAVTPTASAGGGSGGSGGAGPTTPGFAASTGTLAFGTVAVGQASDSETVTVSSTGSAALAFGAVSLAGPDASDFTIGSDTCANQKIASGANCTVTLTFTPSAGGARSATLAFTDDASGSPQTVSLTGTGTTLATIMGKVTDGSGNPVSDVYVQVCPYGNVGSCTSAYTAQDGSYSLPGLTPGEKMMEVRPASANLSDASGVVDAVAGTNEQDFTVAAPVPFSPGLSFNGSSGGTPTSFWTSPDSLTEKLPVVSGGPPGSYGVLIMEFTATPAGADGPQPYVFGRLEVAYQFNAKGVPQYLGQSAYEPTGSALGSWNLGLTSAPATDANVGDLTAQGVFSPPQTGALHGEMSFEVDHFNEYFATLPQSGAGTDSAHTASPSPLDQATQLLNNAFGTAASALSTPIFGANACLKGVRYPGFVYLHGGKFRFDNGDQLQTSSQGVNQLTRLDGSRIAFTNDPSDTYIEYFAKGGVAGQDLFYKNVLLAGQNTGGAVPEDDLQLGSDLRGEYFQDTSGGVDTSRFRFYLNGSFYDTETGHLYSPGALQLSLAIPVYNCYALSSASIPPGTLPDIEEDGDDDDGDGDDGGSDYQDPSGIVRTASHVPVAGAKVMLVRATKARGPFKAVPNGSVTMSPGNRRNPDKTNVLGQFGWDVLPGYYRVTARHKACRVVRGKGATTETKVLTVPPAVVDLDLTLSCPHLARRATHTTLTAKKVPVSEVVLSAHVSGRRPQGVVRFTAGRRVLGVVALGKGSRATLTVPAARARGARATYEGDGLLKPSRS